MKAYRYIIRHNERVEGLDYGDEWDVVEVAEEVGGSRGGGGASDSREAITQRRCCTKGGPIIMARLKTWKRVRRGCYQVARWQGNVQPWLETLLGDSKGPRKILRRQVHRGLGKLFSKQLFGKGLIAKTIKKLLGL